MMGEEFYSIIKLVSGEEIFSLISVDDSNEEPVIILQNPVVMKLQQTDSTTLIKVKPWMELSKEDIFIIRLDKVITMTECKEQKMIDLYNDYLYNDSIETYVPGGKVKVSEEMGYVSSVEESRKRLENLYNNSTNKPKES